MKSRILNLAQTSVYQVKIQPPPEVAAFMQVKGFNYYFEGENLELLCSRTNLPGTFLRTHTVENDYHGVSEQMAYRRQYDETLQLEFYVDRNYNVVEFFDSWIDFISGQGNQNVAKSAVANYRFNFPQSYKNDIYLTKFEKEEKIDLTTYEQDLKYRLEQEIKMKQVNKSKDDLFKEMADMDDPSMLDSGFDFDAKGKFLKGTDGYELGEQLDFHDLEGKEHSTPVPRIIGKTNPKAEVLTEGHPSNNQRLTIE